MDSSAVLRDQADVENRSQRTTDSEILDKLDECEGRSSELLIDLATDESEVNSLINATQQESSEEVVYLTTRTQKKRCDRKL